VTDILLPFQVAAGAVRGRMVRLGPAVESILAGHAYPPPVARLLAETLALAAALAGGLKYDGIFALQAQGDGPVSLVLADVTSAGALRGYARFDAARLAMLGKAPSLKALMGKGHLAFTVDQGPDTDRYQGIVALEGADLAESVELYFRQSEQLDTAVKAAVSAEGGWRAAALVAQRMPAAMTGQPILVGDEAEDIWRRAAILMNSATAQEMLDPAVAPQDLLWRLYHAEQVEAFEPRRLEARCRCSEAKVVATLRSFPADEISGLADDDGKIVVTCEFCRVAYTFTAADLAFDHSA